MAESATKPLERNEEEKPAEVGISALKLYYNLSYDSV